MKLKAILFISIIALLTFLIYLSTIDKKVYFLALGDSYAQKDKGYGYNDYLGDYLKEKKLLEQYIKEFVNKDARTVDLIQAIENNDKVLIDGKNRSIKNALIKSDLLTISIGYNDLLYKIGLTGDLDFNYRKYVDEVMEDIDILFQKIRRYCKEDIIFIGYAYPHIYKDNENVKDYFDYANNRLRHLSSKYKINFLDISFLNDKEEFFEKNNSFINEKGHLQIFNKIKEELDKTIFSKKAYGK